MRIDFADPPQAVDAARPGHANVGNHGIGMFFLQDLDAGVHTVGGVDLVIGLEKHAQTFARNHLVIDHEDLGKVGGNSHGA